MSSPVVEVVPEERSGVRGVGMRVTGVGLNHLEPHKTSPDSDRLTNYLVAMGWVRIEDGTGYGFVLTDVRLLFDTHYNVSLPSEPKKAHCTNCRGKNQLRANYCNWCGHPQKPREKNVYMDMVAPLNSETRTLILEAMLAAYRKQMSQVAQKRD